MGKNILKRYLSKRSTVELLSSKLHETERVSRAATGSKSEYFQDLWVIATLNQKTDGFFVEFGATDGISGSNTWLLETKYNWKGILAEPARGYQEDLTRTRNCKIDFRVIWSESGKKISFSEKEEGYLSAVSTTLQKVAVHDEYEVETVSLNDLLLQHGAPNNIDYVSIDVEGSELLILKEFFKHKTFDVNLFSIEHNWRKDKDELIKLMHSHGYKIDNPNLSYRDLYFSKVNF